MKKLSITTKNGKLKPSDIERIGEMLEYTIPFCFDGKEEWQNIDEKMGESSNFRNEHIRIRRYYRNEVLQRIVIWTMNEKRERKKFTTMLEKELVEKLKKEAAERSVSAADILNELLDKRYR